MNEDQPQLDLGFISSRADETVLSLSKEDRRRHIYVIGQTGSDKTTFLKSCILQDTLSDQGFAVIDLHGDLAEEIIDAIPRSRVRDVVYFNPSDINHPIGFNPLAGVNDAMRPVVVSNIIASLRSI